MLSIVVTAITNPYLCNMQTYSYIQYEIAIDTFLSHMLTAYRTTITFIGVRQQEAQLSQRERAMLHVIVTEYFAALKIIQNDTTE